MYNLNNVIKDMYIMYLRKSRKDLEMGIEEEEKILQRHENILYTFAESLRYK